MSALRMCVVLGLVLTACTSGGRAPTDRGGVPSPESHPLEERLQAELTVRGQPDWITVGYRSVWVLMDEKSAVGRIDPQTDELAATIEVGGHPCNGVSAEFGAIWVPSCSEQKLYRISARDGEVEAAIDIPVFRSVIGTAPSGGLAAGAGAVWMVTEGTKGSFDALARIDRRTNEVTDTIPLGHVGGGVAVGEGAVWVTAPEDGLLLRVDPGSREVEDQVDGLAQPAWVAAGEGGVWVISGTWLDHLKGDGSVARVDPETNEIVARIEVDARPGPAGEITVGAGSVWARSGSTLLARIDPRSNAVVERYDGPERKGLGGVEVGFGSVWLSDYALNKVWRLPLDS